MKLIPFTKLREDRVKFQDLRDELDPAWQQYRTKRQLVLALQSVDQKTRVGGKTGTGRLTAKGALNLLK